MAATAPTPTAPAAGGARPERLAAALILGTALVHVVHAGLFPLAPQEAYYWSWSRRLALSYFDHPPLASWTIAATTSLLGSSERAIRLAAALHATVFGTFFFLAARRLFGGRTALLALALGMATPLFSIGQVIITPDGPLLSGWAMALYFTVRALDDEEPRWLLATGAAAGWALLGKYTAGLLFPQVLALLLWDARGRRMLRTPWPWLGVALAAALFAPVVIWNLQRHLASFAFQTQGRVHDSAFKPILVGRFLALQAGAVTPLLLVLLLDAPIQAWRRRGAPAWRAVLLFSAPLLLLAAVISPFHWVKMNWLAPAWPAALLGAAALIGEGGWRGRLAPWAAGLALAATAYMHLVPVVPAVPFPARDELSSGWLELAARVERERALLPPGAPVIGCSYKPAAELSYYLPDRPETQMDGVFGGAGLQYDVWLDWSRLAGREALLVNDLRERGCARRAEVCTELVALPPETPLRAGKKITTFELYRCRLPVERPVLAPR